MKSLILLSGGVDSAVMLAIAKKNGRECFAVSFHYGQRHAVELESAKMIASHYQTPHTIIELRGLTGSSLLSQDPIPKHRTKEQICTSGTPSTFVPARNTLFLAHALAEAEKIGADEVHFGPNSDDHHPYPDCRKSFIDAFQTVYDQGSSNKAPQIVTPLIHLSKQAVMELAKKLMIPLELTFSCYDPIGNTPCGCCDACSLRQAHY